MGGRRCGLHRPRKARLERNEFDEAIADCDKAIVLDAKSADAIACAATCIFTKAITTRPLPTSTNPYRLTRNLRKLMGIAVRAWIEKGEYDKALADSDKALAIDPKHALPHINRGLVAAHRGDEQKSIAEYKEALEVEPDDWRAINDLGVAYWIQSEKQDKKAAAAEAAGDRKEAESCRRGSAALKDRAMAQWRHGISVSPGALDIYSNLGYAYSQANDLDTAENYLAHAVELNPRAPRPRNNLGRVQLRRSEEGEVAAASWTRKPKRTPTSQPEWPTCATRRRRSAPTRLSSSKRPSISNRRWLRRT